MKMWKNYLKIGVRNLLHNKVSSFINIGGLAIGMAVAILVGLWIWDELSYDTYHQNYDDIVQVKRTSIENGEKHTSDFHVSALGNLLAASYGNHFKDVVMVRRTEEYIISADDKSFIQSGNFMQPVAPEMLSLQMIHGTRNGLQETNTIVLSQTLAKKLFGEENPINEIVKISGAIPVKVTGVYEDLPHNSTFHETSFIAPLDLFFTSFGLDSDTWNNYNMFIYAQLRPEADIDEVNTLIKNEMLNHVDEETAATHKPALFLHPMSKWHLYSEFENGINVAGDRLKFIWFNGIIGIFVLLLACINFMNLSTARSEKRAKEVGIRKTLGSARSQLINQFFSESLLVALLAFGLSLGIVQLILPWFNRIADKEVVMLWGNPWFLVIGIAFAIITGLLAGSYPAFYLSSFNSAKALKGSFSSGRLAAIPRQVLVVFQFSISIMLIIGTIIVYQQIQFAKDRPLGYSQDGLIAMPNLYRNYDALSNELKKTGAVTAIGQANYPLINTLGNNGGFAWPGKEPSFDPSFNTIKISPEYGKTIGWELIDGRDFSRSFKTDTEGVIINESALKLMNLENPIGETIRNVSPNWGADYFGGDQFTIVGVVKDMIKESPFEPAVPSIMFLDEGELSWLFIKMNPQLSVREALPQIEGVFQELFPSLPFEYKFVDEQFAAKFSTEERIGNIATFFAALAIFISCLGLFGLAIFIAEKRTKEIGIRKVLGASTSNLVALLSKDFLKLVLIAVFIAIPFAWYFANNWLQNYTYRIEIQWWVFAVAGVAAVSVALLTVSVQAIRAAVANPIESLRDE